MRIIQISDIHIAPDGIDTFEVDVRANLQSMLDHLRGLNFDILAITGDYCFKEPHANIYHWIAEQLEDIRQPIYHIGGNHDFLPDLHQAFAIPFPLHGHELYYKVRHGDQDLLFLDSAIGRMSDMQFQWLEDHLLATDRPVVLFTHYPPYSLGVPHMDNKYAFQQPERFKALADKCRFPIYVFCGHYHGERTVHRGNVHIHLVPSCFFQIDPSTAEFLIEHFRIAYRTIDLLPGEIRTFVTYLPGAHLASL